MIKIGIFAGFKALFEAMLTIDGFSLTSSSQKLSLLSRSEGGGGGGGETRSGTEKRVVYHLPQIPGNSGWDVNGKRFFGSSHWKIPGTNGSSEKVVPFFPLGRSEWKFVDH